jgi:UDP-glucose 4-epimerase
MQQDLATALRGSPVLVTGAGGFLGSAVVRRLLDLGAGVRALAGPAADDLQPLPAGVLAEHGDIEDAALLDRLVAGVACVYHMAGPPSVVESFAESARHLRVHAAGTATLIERCAAAGVPRIVYVSSAEVYGPASGTVSEEHPRAPRSPYGIAKLAAELLLEAHAAAGGAQVSILRPFSLYGPGASPRSLLSRLLDGLERGELRVADLRPVRDYCFVADAAAVIVTCAARDGARARAFNVASGRGVSVAELARALLRAAGRGDVPLHEDGGDRPAGALTLELVGDPTRARDELGVEATTPLEVGLALTLEDRARRARGLHRDRRGAAR